MVIIEGTLLSPLVGSLYRQLERILNYFGYPENLSLDYINNMASGMRVTSGFQVVNYFHYNALEGIMSWQFHYKKDNA
jgi:hypothetical protein